MNQANSYASPFVLKEDREGVRILTINRPERANAYDDEVSESLIDAFVEAEQSEHVKVVVITGTGERAFCAGRDLKDAGERTKVHPMQGVRNLHEAAMSLFKPTIAAVNGAAVGGGCELALACDMRVASDGSFFQLPEARRGMGANFASVVLPQLISRAVAMELLYTGRRMEASEALATGLINQVVPRAETLGRSLELATEIARNAPMTIERIAHTARKSWGQPLAAALRLDVGPDPYNSTDRSEGARAFFEKRAPQWQGK
jgi:crotonobetainyl-CoA hydratase